MSTFDMALSSLLFCTLIFEYNVIITPISYLGTMIINCVFFNNSYKFCVHFLLYLSAWRMVEKDSQFETFVS